MAERPKEPERDRQINQTTPAPREGQLAQAPHPAEPTQRPGVGVPRRSWRDLAEERILAAREQGHFDNLQGAGQPLQRDESALAGEKALAYHLLKNNDMAPPEIERGQEIDRALRRTDELLATLRHHRDTLLARKRSLASDRRAYNVLRDKTERRYAAELRAINSNILSLNIIAPPALHRKLIAVDARLRAFADEFPRLAE